MAAKQKSAGADPALTKLMGMAGDFNIARETKNPMGQCNAPDGNYIARVSNTGLRLTQNQDPMITFDVPILCDVDGKRDHVGEPARIMHIIKETERQTKAEKFGRLCWDIQTFGYDTKEMTVKDIPAYLEQIKSDACCVIINISTSDNGMQNINLRSRVEQAEVEQLLGESLGDAAPTEAADEGVEPAEAADEAEPNTENWEWSEEHELWWDTVLERWFDKEGNPVPTEDEEDAPAEEPVYEEVAPEPPKPAPKASPAKPGPKATPAPKAAPKPAQAAKPAPKAAPVASKPAAPKGPPRPKK